jgi:hypothetical protein
LLISHREQELETLFARNLNKNAGKGLLRPIKSLIMTRKRDEGSQFGVLGAKPLGERVASNKVRARGRLSPFSTKLQIVII